MLKVIKDFEYGTSFSEISSFISKIANNEQLISEINNLLINKSFYTPPFLSKYMPFLSELRGRLTIERFSNDILKSISNVLLPHAEFIKKKVSYLISECEIKEDLITLKEYNTTFCSGKLSKFFSKSRHKELVLFIYSLGEGVEKLMIKIPENEAYVIDAISSSVIEFFIDEFQSFLKSEYFAKEAGFLRRFSPGYGDWQLNEQSKIFNLLHASEIECKLTDTFYIYPQKSVSGIIGLFNR